jgi:hypothetical protein
MKLGFSGGIFEKKFIKDMNVTKINPIGAELINAGGQPDCPRTNTKHINTVWTERKLLNYLTCCCILYLVGFK